MIDFFTAINAKLHTGRDRRANDIAAFFSVSAMAFTFKTDEKISLTIDPKDRHKSYASALAAVGLIAEIWILV